MLATPPIYTEGIFFGSSSEIIDERGLDRPFYTYKIRYNTPTPNCQVYIKLFIFL